MKRTKRLNDSKRQLIELHQHKFNLFFQEGYLNEEPIINGKERMTLAADPLRRAEILYDLFKSLKERPQMWAGMAVVKVKDKNGFTLRTRSEQYRKSTLTELKPKLEETMARARFECSGLEIVGMCILVYPDWIDLHNERDYIYSTCQKVGFFD